MESRWQPFATWFEQHRDWCMSLLRIYLGIGLTVKGISFIVEIGELRTLLVDNDVFWAGAGLAHFVILTHLLGGVMMAVGFRTRIAAAVQVPNLIGAVLMIHWGGGVFGTPEEFQFSALVLFLLLLFVWHGSGPLSADAYLRAEAESPEVMPAPA